MSAYDNPEATRERLMPNRLAKAVLAYQLTVRLQPLAKHVGLAWVWRWFR